MKYLLIVRHAKSSWDASIPNDIDRPLNSRGKADAPEMAERLKKENIIPDTLVSSPAKRARKTAQLFGKVFDIDKKDIILIDELYNAPVAAFYRTVSGLSDETNLAAIFSHNPGITEFVNSLTSVQVDDMPTCGVFGVKIEASDWEDFKESAKEFWFFNYPKLQS